MEHREYRSELFRTVYEQGEVRGKARGKAEGILAVLAARGIPVSDALRERIVGCTDVELLDAWIRRAASTAATVVRARTPPRHARRLRKG